MEEIDSETKNILKKYERKLREELDIDGAVEEEENPEEDAVENSSREYKQFREEMLPTRFTLYEKACNISEKIIRIKPSDKDAKELQEAINTAHLNTTPVGASSFAILGPLFIILVGMFLSMAVYVLTGDINDLYFFAIFFLLTAAAVMIPLQKMPMTFAQSWRLKTSSQMVLCIFYIVTYMRQSSNLELAIRFSSNYLSGPLALDMKKIIWDIETEKYTNVKESLDVYLEGWRKYNIEFVESMHLIESSLYESSEETRLILLDKALDIMLEETFEKMMHFAQDLKSPMTSLHMLGVILPVLGLVIMPLVTNFMGGVKWYYIAVFYNIVIPLSVFYLGRRALSSRPTGYGDSDISDTVSEFKKYKKININLLGKEVFVSPLFLAGFVVILFLLIGLSPIILHSLGFENIGIGAENDFTECKKLICFLEYRFDEENDAMLGPYDVISAALSVFVPLAFGVGIGVYYKLKTNRLIKLRKEAKALEKEFSSALFQLGNRLGDNLPAEITFGRVAIIMQSTKSGQFFEQVNNNITRLGMSVKEAIFDPNVGALVSFPSNIIKSAMKVLIQSIKKSPKIAAQAVINVSRYMKEMHRVDERLKDLLSDVISSMKSQISFLAPVIAGIVIGITTMMTNILGKLGKAITGGGENAQALAGMSDFFGVGIPTYHMQIIVGLYIVEIIFILSVLVNGIENGYDELGEENAIGNNLARGTVLYCMIAMIVIIVFNIISDTVIMNALRP